MLKIDAFELVCHHAGMENQDANPVSRFILFFSVLVPWKEKPIASFFIQTSTAGIDRMKCMWGLEEFKTQPIKGAKNLTYETIKLRTRERMSTHVSIIDESCWRGEIFEGSWDTISSMMKWQPLRCQRGEVRDLRLSDPRVDPTVIALLAKRSPRRA